MEKPNIKINCCYVNFKKQYKCRRCGEIMKPGEVYFNLCIGKHRYYAPDFMIKYCKECWDKSYIDSLQDYNDKKEDYGKYLKKKIVKSL